MWKKLKNGNIPAGPTLYRGVFAVSDAPSDTFLHMKGWIKGVCFVNGHNLGRYWNVGPQETLYVPAPWLRKGENEVSAVFTVFPFLSLLCILRQRSYAIVNLEKCIQQFFKFVNILRPSLVYLSSMLNSELFEGLIQCN